MQEIRLQPFIAAADIDFERKIGHARDALKAGTDVVLSVRLSGPARTKPAKGLALLDRGVKKLEAVSKVLHPPKHFGGVWRVRLAPMKVTK
ncbi:hypothetical protein LCGC14_1830370, partial [marine sediment metagenome]